MVEFDANKNIHDMLASLNDIDRPNTSEEEPSNPSLPTSRAWTTQVQPTSSSADKGDGNIRSSSTTVPSSSQPLRASIFDPPDAAGNSTTSTPTRPLTAPLPSSGPSRTPLAALTDPSTRMSTPSRRVAHFLDTDDGGENRQAGNTMLEQDALPQAEKDGYDPSTPVESSGRLAQDDYTPTALSKLLGGRVTTSPAVSREPSYNASLLRRLSQSEGASLPEHLYTKGLLGGRHSDITVAVFGHAYPLHRIILDRAPFFASALSEPWVESKAKEITLRPDEVDPNISRNSFELALKRLYGCDIREEEDGEAIGLFAVGCWLEMQDLVDEAIDSILRQMCPESLPSIIKLVTNSYYGRNGERILASAKAMLCRDGWEMPTKHWDGIPGEIVREIIGGDGFYVKGEWERWSLARSLLNRRLKQKAVECGLAKPGTKVRLRAPNTIIQDLVRFNATYRRDAMKSSSRGSTIHDQWTAVYMHPDVEPLLVLLDGGIYYMHLPFEQLQHIRQSKDCFGLPVVPDTAIFNALYMQMELRQKVVNAREQDKELGLSLPVEEPGCQTISVSVPEMHAGKGKGKASERTMPKDVDEPIEELSRPRRFYIPSTDCNIVIGGNADPVITTGSSAPPPNIVRPPHLTGTLDPMEAQWATDLTASPSATMIDPANRTNLPGSHATPTRYSTFPPFRFAAEFPPARLLKEKKRVYSRTVFYAGSLWNIYIQKMRPAKNYQLGVYLHRAKDREDADESSGVVFPALAGNGNNVAGSVDERIGMLEREMLLRSEQRDQRRRVAGTNRLSQGQQLLARSNSSTSAATIAGGSAANRRESAASPASTSAPGRSSSLVDSPRSSITLLSSMAASRRGASASATSAIQAQAYRSNASGSTSASNNVTTNSNRTTIASSLSSAANAGTAGGSTPSASNTRHSLVSDSAHSSRRQRFPPFSDIEDSSTSDSEVADSDTDIFTTTSDGIPLGRASLESGESEDSPVDGMTTGATALSSSPFSAATRNAAAADGSVVSGKGNRGGMRSSGAFVPLYSQPALPPYSDSRPTIKTYFKIYSPSRAGRLLSVYESAPDQFDFSQSWGWRSSTLMLDEGMLGAGTGVQGADQAGGKGAVTSKGANVLRFMVVIGNL